ncbi:hypothetical protein [Dyadobacter sp. CY343]|uniref:hypothetical protein n=1 Tax=Dyadobacter sp. CY343 TaxID=2907299 RepID=UPI001F46577F|nr:hypothetical protein [Dyadobacter sp. CY343]MCE7059487.1 hypothetical protein [Dyadobacter sp. CY343]
MQNDDFKTIINYFQKRIPLMPEEQEYVCSLIKIRHLLPRQYLVQLDKVSIEMLYRQVPVFERFWRIMNESACLAQDERILNAIMMSGAARYEALLSKYPGR